MAPLWRSKTFWAVASGAGTLSAYLAYDEYRTREVRERFRRAAALLGEGPLRARRVHGQGGSETVPRPRKVTVISMADSAQGLRTTRQLWREYAVDLFTLGGCDYQLVQIDGGALSRELYRRTTEAPAEGRTDAEAVPAECRVTPENWIRPMTISWLNRINATRTDAPDDYEYGEAVDERDGELRRLWRERRPSLSSADPFGDGIVCLTSDTLAALLNGIDAWHGAVAPSSGQLPPPGPFSVPIVGYVPCHREPTYAAWLLSVCASLCSRAGPISSCDPSTRCRL